MAITNKTNDVLHRFYNFSGKTKNLFQSNIIITIIIYSLIGLYIVLSLLSLLHSGYYSDDMVNSSLRGQIALEKISFLHYAFRFIKLTIDTQSRFIPISIITLVTVSYLFYNLFFYKTLILVLIIINILLFGYFIKIVFKEIYFSYLLMLCMPLFFQFRLYHDPILSFAGHMQLFFCYLFCALILLQKYLENNNRRNLILSVVFFNISLYAYEISVPLSLLLFILIFDHNKKIKTSLKMSLPFICSNAIVVFIDLFVRFLVPKGYSGTIINLNALLIIKTLIMQIYASIPLSYYVSNSSNLFNHNILILFKNVRSKDLLVILIFNILFIISIRKININELKWKKILSLGLSLLILPAVPIALSAKYQQEIIWFGGWGIGYIPVYIQYYGMLLICTVLAILTTKIIKTKIRIGVIFLLIVIVDLIIIINLQDNRIVVDKANTDLYYGRLTLEKALDNNILENIPENATVLVNYEYKYDPYPPYVFNGLKGWLTGYDWDNRYLFYLHSKKIVNVVNTLAQLGNLTSQTQSDKLDLVGKNIFLLDIESYPEYFNTQHREGYVILGKINYIEINNMDINKSKMYIKFLRVWHEPYASEPVNMSKLDHLKTVIIDSTQTWTP